MLPLPPAPSPNLLQQILQGSQVVQGEAEDACVLAHDLLLKGSAGLLLQLLHAEDNLLLQADELCLPVLLRGKERVSTQLPRPSGPSARHLETCPDLLSCQRCQVASEAVQLGQGGHSLATADAAVGCPSEQPRQLPVALLQGAHLLPPLALLLEHHLHAGA